MVQLVLRHFLQQLQWRQQEHLEHPALLQRQKQWCWHHRVLCLAHDHVPVQYLHLPHAPCLCRVLGVTSLLRHQLQRVHESVLEVGQGLQCQVEGDLELMQRILCKNLKEDLQLPKLCCKNVGRIGEMMTGMLNPTTIQNDLQMSAGKGACIAIYGNVDSPTEKGVQE